MRLVPLLLLAGGLMACGGASTGSGDVQPMADGDTGASASVAEAEPAERPFAALEVNLPRPGDALADFGGATLDGTAVSSATIAGKTALINHWFYG